jgi:hypothetical protein
MFLSCYETSFDIEALIISYGRQDLESRFCSRGDPLRVAEQILRLLAQAVLQPWTVTRCSGLRMAHDGGTGSGSALNQLAEETHYHLFDSPLGRLPSQVRVPASAGSLKDDRGMRETAAAGLKGLLHPVNGHSNQGLCLQCWPLSGDDCIFHWGHWSKLFLP